MGTRYFIGRARFEIFNKRSGNVSIMVGLKTLVFLLLVVIVAIDARKGKRKARKEGKKECSKSSTLDMLKKAEIGAGIVKAALDTAKTKLGEAGVKCEVLRKKVPGITRRMAKYFGKACKVGAGGSKGTKGSVEFEDEEIEMAADAAEEVCPEEAARIQLVKCAVGIMEKNAVKAKPLIEALVDDSKCEDVTEAMKGLDTDLWWLKWKANRAKWKKNKNKKGKK